MSKGLEALERIGKVYYPVESRSLYLSEDYGDDFDVIEKELKALEIIKEKRVDMSTFGAFETYKDYEYFYNMKFHIIDGWDKLNEEEFELLKRC